jgi:hypothetical protein
MAQVAAKLPSPKAALRGAQVFWTDDGHEKNFEMLRDKSVYRSISLAIAVSVADTAYQMNVARTKRPPNLKKAIADFMYEP